MLLFPRLVEVVRELAPARYEIADRAPSTPTELGGQATGTLVVWAGASDTTIFGAPSANWAFRAWHDSMHLESGLGFSIPEEIELGRRQAEIMARYAGDLAAQLVWLEIAGQAIHYRETGTFIINQVAWTLAQLRGR